MPHLPVHEIRTRFAMAQVARLATVMPDGRPHIVPITFAMEGDRIVSLVDVVKPKASLSLVRVGNIEANPHVALLVDEYHDDWELLWWVRADGTARVETDGPRRERAIGLVQARYPQYRVDGLVFGPAVIIEVERWAGWAAAGL
jgi:PPOX class probable F420-dependent enzyme